MCGLNYRFHSHDFRDVLETERVKTKTVKAVQRRITELLRTYRAASELREMMQAQAPLSSIERVRDVYYGNAAFRHRARELYLEFLLLPGFLVSAFDTGTVDIPPGYVHARIHERKIYKQILPTPPEKVKSIFDFMLLDFWTATFLDNRVDTRKRQLQILENLSTRPGMYCSDEVYRNMENWEDLSEYVKNNCSYNLVKNQEEIQELVDSESIEIKDALYTLVTCIGAQRVFTTHWFSIPGISDEYVAIMDLYTLLRFERMYDDGVGGHSRQLRTKSGRLLSSDEYYAHRPHQCEIIFSYAGDYHTQRYLRYYRSQRASVEEFFSPGKRSESSRCIDIRRPVISLFIPNVEPGQVEVVVG
jgi:hypothetical protein